MEEHVDSREQYLHQGGWEDTENPLHEQECVRNEMGILYSSQEMLEHRQCTICKETWSTKQNLSKILQGMYAIDAPEIRNH